ncbi:MAG: copper amine oxidase N-terminal domain-containing protein [Oscillospiraceae bacterium]|nr:copper amine oxidase N-terminal domain-containing protein [Oscillospiraceae bacterium]
MRKRFLATISASALILTLILGISAAATASSPISVYIDGSPVPLTDQSPVFIDGRIFAPVRGVFEHLGFAVDWDETAGTATVTNCCAAIAITAGSPSFTTNEEKFALDMPAYTYDGSMMLPLRPVLESAGYSLTWDPDTQTVQITTAVQAPPPLAPVTFNMNASLEGVFAAENDPNFLMEFRSNHFIIAIPPEVLQLPSYAPPFHLPGTFTVNNARSTVELMFIEELIFQELLFIAPLLLSQRPDIIAVFEDYNMEESLDQIFLVALYILASSLDEFMSEFGTSLRFTPGFNWLIAGDGTVLVRE